MWWRCRRPTLAPDPKATEARVRAEQQLKQQLEETSRVKAMTSGWRRIREQNHFAAALETTFRGGAS